MILKGNYFLSFKSEPSFSPPSSVWTWQSLSVCLALIVLLVFLVIELDYLPSVLQYLSTRRKHLGDFNYVHFVWVLTPRLCNKGVLRRCRETDYLFTSLPALPSTRWCWHVYQLTPPLIIAILWNITDKDVADWNSTEGFFSCINVFKRPNPDHPNGNLLKFLCEENKNKEYSIYCKQRTKATHKRRWSWGK